MKCQFGPATFEAEGKYLTLSLRESNDILRDSAALIERLSEDGYLFLRSIHDRDAVIEARRSILSRLQQRGALDLNAPLMDGVIHPKAEKLTSSVRGNDALKTDELRAVINGLPIMELFERLFASPVASFNYQWLRAAGTGASSGIHCDAPFMSRGSRDLLTCWTPYSNQL